MPKKSRQKFKYLRNEKEFLRWNKSIFYLFWRVIIEANIYIFLEGESPTLIYIWHYVFQQSTTFKTTIFSVYQAQTDGLSDDSKASKFHHIIFHSTTLESEFEPYNIEIAARSTTLDMTKFHAR